MIVTAQPGVGGASHDRARRFEIRTPIRYRSGGESRWHKGITENISSSGVLFQCEDPVGLETSIEMEWEVPVGNFGNGGARVHCRGLVVRLAKLTGALTTLAVSISHYRLARS